MLIALIISGCQSPNIKGLFPDRAPEPLVEKSEPEKADTPRREQKPETAEPSNTAVLPSPDVQLQIPAPDLTAPPIDDAPVKVGLLLPLSGKAANVGQSLLKAAQMALFDFGDKRIELLPMDTGGNAQKAALATEKVLNQGAELILGPLFAGSVQAAAPIARNWGVSMVAFSSDSTTAGNGVFLLSFPPEAEIERVTGYAVRKGLFRFAALAPNTDYGRRVAQNFRNAINRRGRTLVDLRGYEQVHDAMFEPVKQIARYYSRTSAMKDYRRSLTAQGDEEGLKRIAGRETLGDVPYDAILLAEGGANLTALASLLPYYDVDPGKVKFLGTGLWDDPSIGREPAVVGGWFAAPQPETRQFFSEQFKQIYGQTPPRIASLAYDAVALTAVLSRGNPANRFSAAALANPNGFAGMDGIFRFRTDGVPERGLAIMEVEKTGLRVIDPAPVTFEGLYN